MESLSKTRITRRTAQTIIRHFFGTGKKISSFIELKEGFFNSAYHLIFQDGYQIVLKIAPPPDVRILRYEKGIMRTEVEVMKLVKDHTEMPIPGVLFFDDRCDLLPSHCFAMEFISGEPLHKIRSNINDIEKSAIDHKVGVYLRQMNAISNELFGGYAQSENRSISWAQAFDNLLQDVLLDGVEAKINLPFPPGDILDLTRSFAAVLNEVTIPSLVHWDLWDGNIFVDPKTNTITGIVDFERALWADPLMEPNFGAFGINHHFLQGYDLPYPFSASQSTRRTLYNIYLYLIMVIESTYRQYPNHDQENWARMRLNEEINILQKQIP